MFARKVLALLDAGVRLGNAAGFAAEGVHALVYGNGVAALGDLMRCRESSHAGTQDNHPFRHIGHLRVCNVTQEAAETFATTTRWTSLLVNIPDQNAVAGLLEGRTESSFMWNTDSTG
jgi:hypothetical protein